jgi:hypothetical protein
MSPRIDYVREYRVLSTQIDKLSALIRAGQARLARSGECTTEEAHAMNELRVELVQRRKRRAEIARNVQSNLDKTRAEVGIRPRISCGLQDDAAHATHVIVGDHDPEPRVTYAKPGRSTGYLIHPRGVDPDEGLRVVAMNAPASGAPAAYRGQWLHTDVWRTVVNSSGLPIVYSTSRAAIEAARWVRSQITDPKARRA